MFKNSFFIYLFKQFFFSLTKIQIGKPAGMKKILLACILFYISSQWIFAQPQNIVKQIVINQDTLLLDSNNMIIPESVIVKDDLGNIVSEEIYSIDPVRSLLILHQKPESNSIIISYRTFPFNFKKELFHKDVTLIEKEYKAKQNPFVYTPDKKDSYLKPADGLSYNGSYARGISFGNNQDVSLTSSFNLQMSGRLNNDVDVVAAITDNNIPIQPDGNTQQIQDFDNIFIQLKKDNTSLIMGDFQLLRPENDYFMNFHKKSQGASVNTIFNISEQKSLNTSAGLGISRGKWARNQFVAQEGNQGPYKLTGSSGETFIIVLSGTERIYIDGKPMERGADRDYIIDYNSGEVTFMPRQLITKDKRINIEFQYTSQAYLRTLLNVNNEYVTDKYAIHFNLYSEQDAKNQPIQQNLDENALIALQMAGDNQAILSGQDSIGYTADRILYKAVDSLGFDSIFIYSTNPDSAIYAVTFSYVGKGNGNYVIGQSLANGRVYNWVPPVGSILQGEYEPIITLIAPNKQQLFTVGGNYQLSKTGKLSAEVAYSNNDLNTSSSNGNSDNQGIATMLGYQEQINVNEERKIKMITDINYEFKNRDFNYIERYRAVEFNRDWNIAQTAYNGIAEHVATAGINIIKAPEKKKDITNGNLNYYFSTFLREDIYSGYKHSTNSNLNYKGFNFLLKGSQLFSKDTVTYTSFFRPILDVSKTFEKLDGWKTGFYRERESNRIFSSVSDSLMNNSFRYDVYKVYVNNNPDSSGNEFGADITRRVDHIPVANQFKVSTEGTSYNLHGGLLKNNYHQLRWDVTHRELIVRDTNALNAKNNEYSTLGRAEYLFIVKKGFIRSNTLYEVISGQERKREFSYIQVPVGQGQYTWQDNNSNGIKELNEFQQVDPLIFPDLAIYQRVFTFTNDFVRTNQARFNEILAINPKVIWYKEEGFKKMVSRFSTQTSFQVDRKIFANDEIAAFNPFVKNIEDSLLVSTNTIIRNSLFFNRSSNIISIEWSNVQNQNKSLLISGFETRILDENSLKLRWNISRSITTGLNYKTGIKAYDSKIFVGNSYYIRYDETEPTVSYLSGNTMRVSLTYKLQNSINSNELGGEKSIRHNIITDMRYNTVGKSAVNARVSFVKAEYVGNVSTSVAFVMLDGLQPGNNYLWSLTYERNISKNIQMTIGYDGRLSGVNKPVVHVGRAQVRALF